MDKGRSYGRNTQKTGRAGEDEACRFLIGNGHTVLKRNWRSGNLEIDIISCDQDGIHFVEVKSRCLPYSADPVESVDKTKQRRIAAAAESFVRKSAEDNPELEKMECFFDVVTVVFDGNDAAVEYYPQAYMPIRT